MQSDTVVQDIGVVEDNIRLVKECVEQLGGLDIIINNAGWTRFTTFGDLNDLSHEEWNKVGER
jgi:NAD(P)-dependent dehydrogenase (short-subunit alcohol dehydrogenase family)